MRRLSPFGDNTNMAGIFPEGGVPANQTVNAQPGVQTVSAETCFPFFYSAQCIPRFDPIQSNAVISEIANVVNNSGQAYDCARLDNMSVAIQYFIQQGIAQVATSTSAPSGNDYTAVMNPTLRYLTEGQLVVWLPNQNNGGDTTLNIDGVGAVPIVRNDGVQLQAGDVINGSPLLLVYRNGAFHASFLLPSQVPISLTGDVDFWIRTDGNDNNSGRANTAQEAFRTIQGAWEAIGNRYAASPNFTINMRFGIPGTYEAPGPLGPYGGRLALIGDYNNPGGYIIKPNAPPSSVFEINILLAQNIAQFRCEGFVISMDNVANATNAVHTFRINGGAAELNNVNLVQDGALSGSTTGHFITAYNGTVELYGTINIVPQQSSSGSGIRFMFVVNGGSIVVGFDTRPCLVSVTSGPANGDFILAASRGYIVFRNGSTVSAATPQSGFGQGDIYTQSLVELNGRSIPGDAMNVDSGTGAILVT